MNDPGRWRLFAIVLGLCFLAGGLIGISHGLTAMAWPSAPAKIITSEIVGYGDERSANVVAEFKLGSSYYECGKVAFGGPTEYAEVPAYPVGRQIQVHYLPDDPNQCVFRPGISVGSIVFLLFAAATFAFALYAHFFPSKTDPLDDD